MKILVTGGSGFIGSNFIFKALKENYTILNIDNLSYSSNFGHNIKLGKKYYFINTSILDRNIFSILNQFKPDYLIHFAAQTHVDNSINKPKIFLKTNIDGTYNLLESSLKYYRLSKKKRFCFHHISTDEVFGDIPKLIKPVDENYKMNPSSPYSASKAASDNLVKAWGRTYELPYLITNCSNNYGPMQNSEKLIPKIIFNLVNNKPIPIYGNGLQIRDWIYVEDHVTALLKLLKSKFNNESFNISSSLEKTNLEIVKMICETMKKIVKRNKLNIQSDYEKLIKFVEDRKGHDLRYSLSSKKLIKKMGWRPKFSLSKGLDLTVNWYLNNYDFKNNKVRKNFNTI